MKEDEVNLRISTKTDLPTSLVKYLEIVHSTPQNGIEQLIKLLFVHGLRISEVLNLQRSALLPSGHVVITDEKMDRKYIVYYPELLKSVLPFDLEPESIIFPFSYNQVYRHFKQKGYIIPDGKAHQNDSVTHYGRILFVNYIHCNRKHDFDTFVFIAGHTSKITNQYYIRRLKNGTSNVRYIRNSQR